MTFPFFVEDPISDRQVEVPQEILFYCDNYTVDSDRLNLRYLDCVNMHMGYYGTPSDVLKKYRDNYYDGMNIRPIFE